MNTEAMMSEPQTLKSQSENCSSHIESFLTVSSAVSWENREQQHLSPLLLKKGKRYLVVNWGNEVDLDLVIEERHSDQ